MFQRLTWDIQKGPTRPPSTAAAAAYLAPHDGHIALAESAATSPPRHALLADPRRRQLPQGPVPGGRPPRPVAVQTRETFIPDPDPDDEPDDARATDDDADE